MNGIISVEQYGENILNEINYDLKRLIKQKVEAVQLYLDLADPLTSVLCSEFEKMGFFFCGTLPANSR